MYTISVPISSSTPPTLARYTLSHECGEKLGASEKCDFTYPNVCPRCGETTFLHTLKLTLLTFK